jgi:hypothetical protein
MLSPLTTPISDCLAVNDGLQSSGPLWKRVPARGDDGRLLSDFIMLIPGLGRRSPKRVEATVAELHAVLAYYRDFVVFADLNLKLNVLWVSVKPSPGITLELAAAVNQRVPEARLVANKGEILAAQRMQRSGKP